jgi:cell division septal protein FtsQ
MSNAYRRHYRVRAKVLEKRKRRAGSAFKLIFLTVLACGLLFFGWRKANGWIAHARSFTVQKIEVTGLSTISEGRFLECLPDNYRNNLLLSCFVNFSRPVKRYFPQIKKVSVTRVFPHLLRFRVVERVPVCYTVRKERAYGVDEESCVFPLLRGENPLPELTASEENISEGIALLNRLMALNGRLYAQITKLCVSSGGEITFFLKDGPKILWGRFDSEELGSKLKCLNDVMYDATAKFRAIEYIDLRLANENRVTVKPAAKA